MMARYYPKWRLAGKTPGGLRSFERVCSRGPREFAARVHEIRRGAEVYFEVGQLRDDGVLLPRTGQSGHSESFAEAAEYLDHWLSGACRLTARKA